VRRARAAAGPPPASPPGPAGAEASPAEAYAAFKRRRAEAPIDSFQAGLGFPLDPYQREACAGLMAGESVLVAAPTGAGKTVVAWFGVDQALAEGSGLFSPRRSRRCRTKSSASYPSATGPGGSGC
jgi:ATP-dependent RNA helicase HelY